MNFSGFSTQLQKLRSQLRRSYIISSPMCLRQCSQSPYSPIWSWHFYRWTEEDWKDDVVPAMLKTTLALISFQTSFSLNWGMPLALSLSFIAGKMSNIEGIEKSTEDDINNDNIVEIAKSTTEDYDYSPPSYKAPVKEPPQLKTTPQGKFNCRHHHYHHNSWNISCTSSICFR